MEITQIEERIEKKKAQIEKIEKRIAKWQNAKSDAGFKREYTWLMDKGTGLYWNNLTRVYDMTFDNFKKERFDNYIENCDSEIKYAERDLKEANLQLEKYNNQLKMEKAKQNKLDSDRIQILVDFLDNWKSKVTDYIHEDVKNVNNYYNINHEACEVHNNAYSLTQDGQYPDTKAAYAASKELFRKAESIKANCSDLSFKVYDKKADNLTDDKMLKEILDKEADNKYLKLVDSITAKVGEITDYSNLEIGLKGDIEGYITGTKGKVHIRTIGAGGYNIQCYHYRTIITPVRN